MKELNNKYLKEKFEEISPAVFAERLREQFAKDPKLWYKVITPKEIADELMQETNNDYSQIWESYCDNCFTPIDKNTSQPCYISDDKITFLCSVCYSKIFGD